MGRNDRQYMTTTEESETRLIELVERISRLSRVYGTYRGAKLRAVARRKESENGGWLHLLGSLRVSRKLVDEESWSWEDLSDDLALLVADLPLEKIDRVLAPILKLGVYRTYPGEFRPQGQTTVSMGTSEEKPPVLESPEFLGRGRFLDTYGEPNPGLVYHLTSHLDLHRELDLAPRQLAELGFNSRDRFLWRYAIDPIGVNPANPYVRGSGFHVIVPNYHARIRSATIEGKVIKVEVDSAKGVPLRDLSLTVQPSLGTDGTLPPQRKARLHRRAIAFECARPPTRAMVELLWNRGANEVERFADQHHAERAELVSYPRLTAYMSFDPGMEQLESHLLDRGQRRDASNLEWAVATVLSIAGFHVEWPGYLRGKSSSELDVIAFHPERETMILVECTLKAGDIQRKIMNVVEAGAEISGRFQGWEVRKAVATTLRSTSVNPSDDQDANRQGVSLLTHDRLKALLTAIRSATPPSEVLEEFFTVLPVP